MELDLTATAKVGEGARGIRQNTTDTVPILEVTATTRLWAGKGYYTPLAGRLTSLAFPRDPLNGAFPSGRTHDLTHIVTSSNRTLLPQSLPSTSQLWLLYPSLTQAQESK